MIEGILEVFKDISIPFLIGMVLISWYFRSLKTYADKLNDDIIKMNARIDYLEKRIYDREIYRINSIRE